MPGEELEESVKCIRTFWAADGASLTVDLLDSGTDTTAGNTRRITEDSRRLLSNVTGEKRR